MLTRSGLDWTARFRPIGEVLTALKARAAYIDGEIAVLTAECISDFGTLQVAPRRSAHLAGRDPSPLPLVERKAIMEKLIVTVRSGNRCSSGCEDRVAKEVRREKPR